MTPPIQVFSNKAVYEKQVRNAASWFYWIVGFTAIFTVVDLFGGKIEGLFGLALPIYLAIGGEKIPAVVCIVVSTIAYGAVGLLASRGARWAFIVGLVFYVIDAGVFAVATDWLPVALHAYAIWRIAIGIPAAGELAKILRADKAQAQAQGQIGGWYGGAQPTPQPGAQSGAWPPPPQPAWQQQPPPAPGGWQAQQPPQQTGWQPQFTPAEQQQAQPSASQPTYSQLSAPEAPAYHTPVPGDLTAEEAPAPAEP